MTDAEKRDAAVAELKKTTQGYLKSNGDPRPTVGAQWKKGLDWLAEIGVVVEPPPPPPPPPPSGAILFQDDFETNFPATSGLNPNAAPNAAPNTPAVPSCWPFSGRGTWARNLTVNNVPSTLPSIANVVPPVPMKGARAMRFDLPATLVGNQSAFAERSHNHDIGERYYGTMLYLPSTWREPSGAADDTNNSGHRWGCILNEIMYPPYIQGGGRAATHLHADSMILNVSSGDGVFGTLHSSGSGRFTRYGNQGGYLWNSGNLGPYTDWMVIPAGQMNKEVVHEIIIGVNWTFGPANGGTNGWWRAWWRRKGESTWNQTVNVSGPYPTHWWGRDMDGCSFTTTQMTGAVTYSNLGPYRGPSKFPLTYWGDNYVEATTFDAVAATMP